MRHATPIINLLTNAGIEKQSAAKQVLVIVDDVLDLGNGYTRARARALAGAGAGP